MIDVKQAVTSAATFVQEMYPSAKDVLLEEVELADYGPFWNVVLSFQRGDPSVSFLGVIGPSRVYRLVEVDLEGQPRKIKAWKQ